jgi:hypothetical protein
LILTTNLNWFFNPYPPRYDVLVNAYVLYVYNIVSMLAFALFWNKIRDDQFRFYFLISGLILFLSMLLQFLGLETLPFAGDVRHGHEEELSFFGVRYGGYAEDQNYATFGMVIWCIMVFSFYENKFLKVSVFLMAVLGVMISFSKTILIASFLILSFVIAKKLKVFFWFKLGLTILALISVNLVYESLGALGTMSTRFMMWDVALRSSLEGFLLGAGNTSVRCNFEYQGYWHVQCHNSFVAMLHDNGLLVLVMYSFFIWKQYRAGCSYYKVLLGFLLILSFTQELFVFQYPYAILVLVPIMYGVRDRRLHLTKMVIGTNHMIHQN